VTKLLKSHHSCHKIENCATLMIISDNHEPEI